MKKKIKAKSRAANNKTVAKIRPRRSKIVVRRMRNARNQVKASTRKNIAKEKKRGHRNNSISSSNYKTKKIKEATHIPKKVVRIMGHGQFKINSKILKRLSEINALLVDIVANERVDDVEFKNKLAELNRVTISQGKPVAPGEMAKSDIILPSSDLPIDEAKKLFVDEGIIPEN